MPGSKRWCIAYILPTQPGLCLFFVVSLWVSHLRPAFIFALSLLSQIEEGRAEQNNALPFVFITFLLNLTSLRDEQPDYEHGATFLFVSIASHEF